MCWQIKIRVGSSSGFINLNLNLHPYIQNKATHHNINFLFSDILKKSNFWHRSYKWSSILRKLPPEQCYHIFSITRVGVYTFPKIALYPGRQTAKKGEVQFWNNIKGLGVSMDSYDPKLHFKLLQPCGNWPRLPLLPLFVKNCHFSDINAIKKYNDIYKCLEIVNIYVLY